MDVLLIHGWGSGPHKNWLPWLRAELEARGYSVLAPQLPHTVHPKFKEWLPALKRLRSRVGRNTVIVGHSLGGISAIHLLASTNVTVRGLVLVGAPLTSRTEPKEISLADFFTRRIPWETVKARAGKVIVIHGKDDPYVPFDHGLRYTEILGAKLIHPKRGGHFIGKRYPFLKDNILKALR